MLETPDACGRCGGAVYQEDYILHENWHADIDRIVGQIQNKGARRA